MKVYIITQQDKYCRKTIVIFKIDNLIYYWKLRIDIIIFIDYNKDV